MGKHTLRLENLNSKEGRKGWEMPIPMSTSFRCLKSHHQDNQRQVSAQGKERCFFKKTGEGQPPSQ